MTSAFSWQNSISLCPASFRIPRPNLPVTAGVSWLPSFAFQSPIVKRTSFLGVLKVLVGLHRTIQLQLLQCCWLGHSLDCHKSAVSLSMLNVSLNVSPLTQWLPQYGDRTAASVPPPTMGRSSPTNTSVFSPNSLVLPSFARVYIFFSAGQILLFTLS